MFMVYDPMGNRVVLYEKTWLQHTAPKRTDRDERLPDLGEVREAVLNPDRIRRSAHPVIGNQSCVFEKFIGPENQLLRTPVIYDLAEGTSYDDKGQSSGHVMTAFFHDPYYGQIKGEIFWNKPKPEDKEGE
jgi:hypothetical protein